MSVYLEQLQGHTKVVGFFIIHISFFNDFFLNDEYVTLFLMYFSLSFLTKQVLCSINANNLRTKGILKTTL